MKKKEVFLTSEGYLELETELNYLKTDKRNEVLNSLKSSNIYRTDIDGSIEIKLNKKGYDITTYSP